MKKSIYNKLHRLKIKYPKARNYLKVKTKGRPKSLSKFIDENMNLLEMWQLFFKDHPSPKSFIDWTLYWMVSAAQQRRIWYFSDSESLFTNLYVVFVAPPATGKSRAARWAREDILETFKVPLSPENPTLIQKIPFSADCTTFEQLVAELKESTRSAKYRIIGEEKDRTTSGASLTVLLSEEFTSMFRKNTEDIVSLFRQCYDGRNYRYSTKHQGDYTILNPLMTMLGCTNQTELNKLLRTGILSTGFVSRIIFINEEAPRSFKPFFALTDETRILLEKIKQWMAKIISFSGPLSMTPEAWEYYIYWCENTWWKCRVNTYKGLDEYYGRKNLHLLKLASCIHFCRTADMLVTLDDMQYAERELAKVEINMHKAISASGRNELAETSAMILQFIEKKKSVSLNEITINFWGESSREETLACVNYLCQTTLQIRYNETDRKYHYVERV